MAENFYKRISENRKAHYDYFVEDTITCGIVLHGTEVKSIKSGHVSFPDGYVKIVNNELYLVNMNINEYQFSSFFSHNPKRDKKLLAHADEIKRLKRKVDEKGYTLIPLVLFNLNGLIKVEVGVCKGKKDYDKRETIKKRDIMRDSERDFKYKV